MKHLLPALVIVCVCSLNSGQIRAQNTDTRPWDLPAWITNGPYQMIPVYQHYIDHRSRRAVNPPGTQERLVARANSFVNSGSTLDMNDSTRFWYSGARGMENGRFYGSEFDIPQERRFDSLIWYGWDTAQKIYQPSTRIRRSYDGLNSMSAYESDAFGPGGWQNLGGGVVLRRATGTDSFSNDIAALPNLFSHAQLYQHNSAGDLINRRLLQSYQGSGWAEIQELRYTYDVQERPVQIEIISKPPATPSAARLLFTYTGTGKFGSLTLEVNIGGNWEPQTRWISKYNTNDEEVIRVHYNGRSAISWNTNDSFSIMGLLPGGMPMGGLGYSVINGVVSLEYRRSYQYNTAGQQLSMTDEEWDGTSFVNKSRLLQTYTPSGKEATKASFVWNGTAWDTRAGNYQSRYYWEQYTTGISKRPVELAVSIAPVPASRNLQIRLKSPETAPVHAVIYNSAGVLTGSWTNLIRNGTGSIDVAALPAGLYQLRLFSTQGSWTGSFNVLH